MDKAADSPDLSNQASFREKDPSMVNFFGVNLSMGCVA